MVADCSVSLQEIREENQERLFYTCRSNKPFKQTVPKLAGAKPATTVSNDAMTPNGSAVPGANNDSTDPAKQRSKINSAINVTPMVDVMLVLLIIFMVITPMLQPGRAEELAKTANPTDMADANRADALIVAVERDGRVFLDSEMVSGETLTQRLKERLANQSDKTIYVRADARAKYKFVVDAVDDIRSAGVDRLGLLTEQRQFTMTR